MTQPLAHVLPDSRFGMTQKRFNVSEVNGSFPHREVLLAANRFNEQRYEKLTHQQRMFVDEYLAGGFDATQAARLSGFARYEDGDGKGEKVARRVGRRLLKQQYIALAIEYAMQYHAERAKLRVEDIIAELRAIGFANMGDYYQTDENGEPILVLHPEMGRDKLAAVSEITQEVYLEGRGETAREVKKTKFKLYNKQDALAQLLKHLQATGDPSAGKPVEAAPVTNVTNVRVDTINIVPVPSGTFLPPPEPPKNFNPLLVHRAEEPLVTQKALPVPDWAKGGDGIRTHADVLRAAGFNKTIDHEP